MLLTTRAIIFNNYTIKSDVIKEFVACFKFCSSQFLFKFFLLLIIIGINRLLQFRLGSLRFFCAQGRDGYITHSLPNRVSISYFTVCPKSGDQLYIVSNYIKWVTSSWTYYGSRLVPDYKGIYCSM